MNSSVQIIPLSNLALAFIPVVITLVILYRWALNSGNAVYAVFRMLVQLLLIGYLLNYIFAADHSLVILAILLVMIIASSWIALGVVKEKRIELFRQTAISITIGGGLTLLLVTQLVLQIHPWYQPHSMVPLAGMIFANSMNSVSLAAERLGSELKRGLGYDEAKQVALQASLIPKINSLFAVGLVSLPGMMTGQILSGVSPLIAARYQIMVMCMVFGAAGISTAIFLVLSRTSFLSSGYKPDQYKPEEPMPDV
jgi:putative ABC transport system permease protein